MVATNDVGAEVAKLLTGPAWSGHRVIELGSMVSADNSADEVAGQLNEVLKLGVDGSWSSQGCGARSGHNVRTRCICGRPEGRHGVGSRISDGVQLSPITYAIGTITRPIADLSPEEIGLILQVSYIDHGIHRFLSADAALNCAGGNRSIA